MMRNIVVMLVAHFGMVASVCAQNSVCFGTPALGRLQNGVPLPAGGENFESYSTIGGWLGRTYVHSTVHQIIVNAYKSLEESKPDTVFKYGETGYEEGGKFSPHKTHQNGLSVDFFVPVLVAESGNEDKKSAQLPTHMFNRYGYDIEFDDKGRYDDYVIDYEAMATHIVSLHRAALALNVNLTRVIFAPELQPYLFDTEHGAYLRTNIKFSEKRSWVRHDEHYHVDFAIDCEKM